jgi:hypothetical protein
VNRATVGAAGILGAAGVVYGRLVRPRLWRWGATEEEVTRPFPGAERVPGGERGVTMAVTIEAPPDQVWPWLVQLGGDRGGWYSWDHLDNAGVSSAHEVHPEWQDRSVGDRLKVRMPVIGMVDSYEIAILEPNQFLGLYWLSDLRGHLLDPNRPRPGAYMEGLWCFQLSALDGGRTRLVIDGYQATRPRWLERFYNYWIYVPVVWIMQARMLAVLKRNVERATQTRSAVSASNSI